MRRAAATAAETADCRSHGLRRARPPGTFNGRLEESRVTSVRGDARAIYRGALPVLLVALGGLFAGLVLEDILESVDQFPGPLVMVPRLPRDPRKRVRGARRAHLERAPPEAYRAALSAERAAVNAVVASFINGIGMLIFVGVSTVVLGS